MGTANPANCKVNQLGHRNTACPRGTATVHEGGRRLSQEQAACSTTATRTLPCCAARPWSFLVQVGRSVVDHRWPLPLGQSYNRSAVAMDITYRM